ncbi:mechanosensitive ion channel family protein [Kordiimonas marina]|uniref:mechanosensitive ion channel family protein n=1 Tax=Kordiimonas marina TaxID=2872312 RepID=UPI001FF5C13D|nr:mechanosensitive ion channel domain-containing protein [Kordiimonas marina]MCJ9428345.1 mechanosensitive ion channel [Kordiimonas marina]
MSVLGSIILPKSSWAKLGFLALLAALFAAGALGYLTPVQTLLDSEALTFHFMDVSITPYRLVKALLIVAMFMWLAGLVSDMAEKQVNRLHSVRASNRTLLAKALTLLIYLVFGISAIDLLGINLGALAVLGGAVGIGVGFGLQKITSNFISGIILLVEKSVEVDDLIELSDGTQGFVRHTSARYSLIETFDGREVMVPNEDFITGRVTNWTLTTKKGRVEIPVGVAYGSDIDLVEKLLLEAAHEHPRCAHEPEPQCFLDAFADSSVNFALYFWVDDVTEGRRGPKSDVMKAIWHKFAENGIEIPFPQRDLHIKGGLPAAAVSPEVQS